MGQRGRVCSRPLLDLSTSKRVSMLNRLPNSTLSSRGIDRCSCCGAGDQVKAPLPEALQQHLDR